ncbi:MAG: adenylyl-sulfate kinase [Kiloniellales bacterium]
MAGPVAPLRVVFAGQARHGRTTLVERLSRDGQPPPPGRRRGKGAAEQADSAAAATAEPDRYTPIDPAETRLRTGHRELVLIDARDPHDLLRRMTGAGAADAGVLVIDATAGVGPDTHRCRTLMWLFGLKQLLVIINKMDLVGYDRARFDALVGDISAHHDRLGLTVDAFIPVSARDGDNVAQPSARMKWYRGPTLVQALNSLTPPRRTELSLRIPLAEVRKSDGRRILIGRVESGRLGRGDRLLFSPSNKTATVAMIEAWSGGGEIEQAATGDNVGITLDEPIFVEPGEIASHESDPPIETSVFRARLFWLDDKPLEVGNRYGLRLSTREAPVSVQEIERVIDTENPDSRESPAILAEGVARDGVAEVVLRSQAMLALDEARVIDSTGRFALVDDGRIVGGGLINMEGYPDQRPLITVRSTNVAEVSHRVPVAARQARSGHRGGVLWFTGLSGAGKSTLAMAVEQALFRKGYLVYVLDGDNVRRGLNANLGFAPEDRAENIRRIGEVAALFADSGLVVITAFISPYRTDRERARRAAGDEFAEVYIKADLAICEARDPKGLYKRARAGEIADFTGISAPYEPPDRPDLVVDTGALDVDACVEEILAFVDERFGADGPPAR